MSADTVKQNNQLGRDFITYLCYKSDENEGLFKTSGARRLHVWVGDKVLLADDNTPPNSIIYSGEHFTGADLKQAIRSGKKVTEAQFKMETDEVACAFMIRGERFDISNLRILSSASGADDSEAQFYARMLSIEQINTVLDDLYYQFLSDISGKLWEQEGYQKFHAWLNDKTDY
jgi:hypothetical protein